MAQTKKTGASSAHKASATIHSAAKTASNPASKTARATLTAVETTRANAETAIRMSSDTLKEVIVSGTEEVQKAQEKLLAISREGAENLARSTETASRSLNEALTLSRENMEAAMEVTNIAANIVKDISTELFNFSNEVFADNVELSKDLFACRTVNDVLQLQSKLLKYNMESFFSESVKLSELLFQFAAETAEPINERVADATERFSKSLKLAA